MIFYNKEEAVWKMNQLGVSGRSFMFIVDYKQEHVWVAEPDSIDPDEVLYDLNGFTNVITSGKKFPEKPFEWEALPVSYEAYSRSFQTVSGHIHAGNSYLVNLTCATPVRTNLTLEEIFYFSRSTYKLWVKDRFVVFSPEIFVRLENGFIYSYPMKGTIDASLPNAREQILADKKEEAEHATIVDLIRNDLSQVASEVTVSRYRYVDELQTNKGRLLQVSSEIRGKLPDNWKGTLGDILFCLLPAGSITGAPKKKTMEIIEEAETYERGFYTGVMGYFDGNRLDSAVMIRFLEQEGNRLLFKSGGGITSQSDLQSEYNEMKQKVYVPIY
ncbi:aminodeoxychorismate synthase component I [uncultured Parabacteroides sp.]|uniref:aminodeoxychorismate synthase component I n=1 Tax=uncultured Parabacteroides sp. TaxID=512312 RepID=UPI002589174F|nr:aminodeoxychorismate synthase component I [uncultured Parabacteroides sp.]